MADMRRYAKSWRQECLFFIQPTGRISRSLIERLFIHGCAELFPKLALRLQSPHFFLTDPELRKELWVIQHHGHFHVVLIRAVPAFGEVHRFAVDVAKMIDPGSVVDTDCFHNELVSIPSANRVSVPLPSRSLGHGRPSGQVLAHTLSPSQNLTPPSRNRSTSARPPTKNHPAP